MSTPSIIEEPCDAMRQLTVIDLLYLESFRECIFRTFVYLPPILPSSEQFSSFSSCSITIPRTGGLGVQIF